MRRTSFTALACTVVALAALAACGPISAHAKPPTTVAMAATSPATATAVQIKNFAFSPATLVVAPGASVTWTNADDEPHTVTASDRTYRSAPLDTDQSYAHVYATPGEYHYFCSLHPHMMGVVIVRAGGTL